MFYIVKINKYINKYFIMKIIAYLSSEKKTSIILIKSNNMILKFKFSLIIYQNLKNGRKKEIIDVCYPCFYSLKGFCY